MTRQEAEIKLHQIFGLAHFYDEQWFAIERVLKGERILMIERTGFGKSLCYQFPATQFPGITVVFSPLIALMRDQVHNLKQKGIPSAYINSEQTPEHNSHVIQLALANQIKILYIAPERQENQEWINATRDMKLSMVVIDEAHTISTWGHDFRPAFRRIIDLVKLLPVSLPVLATTATATKKVQKDIETQIGGHLTTIRGNLNRENLHLQVVKVKSEDEKLLWLASNLNNLPGTGLIYTGTRIDTEIYAKWLHFTGISATEYNAGFDAATRKDIEKGLMQNKWKCVVSTNALGMGIDKPDIRFIIHTQIPSSPIHYYQEIGRAGRDGKPAKIILFYNESLQSGSDYAVDYQLPLSFIENAKPSAHKYRKVIDLVKEEPLSEREIVKKANINTNQFRVIKADLTDQGIIKAAIYGRSKKYEYQYNAKEFDMSSFHELREYKKKDLDAMVGYVYTDIPRMKYLCDYIDNEFICNYSNCDNTNMPKLFVAKDTHLLQKLEEFRNSSFPDLDLAEYTVQRGTGYKVRTPRPDIVEIYKDNLLILTCNLHNFSLGIIPEADRPIVDKALKKHLRDASRLTNGYAASYYAVSHVGAAIHRSKYENGGDFPDFLVTKVLSVIGKKYRGIHFNLVLYVPPTMSGDLVKHFAEKIASIIKVPISHDLVKTRKTNEQKIFQNSYSKKDNVAGAFTLRNNIVKGKTVLLIDDIYDSGATLKEIGKQLTMFGAKFVVPLVIAKTVGGTL